MDFNFTLPSDRPIQDDLDFNPMVRALTRPTARTPKRHGTGLLDLLGDYIMESTGLGEIKRANQLRNAMANYDSDPEGTIANVTEIDPIYGAKLRDQIADNVRLDATQASLAESRKSRTAYNDQVTADRRRKTAASYLYPILNDPKMTPEQKAAAYSSIRPRLLNAFPDNDYLKLSQELPENYDDIALGAFVGGGSTVGQQQTADLRKEGLQDNRDYRGRRLEQIDRSLDQGEERIGIMRDRANTYAASSGASRRAKPVMRYPGEDGYYHVQFDDGSEIISNVKVRPTGKSSILDGIRGDSAPAPKPAPKFKEGQVLFQGKNRFVVKGGKPVYSPK